MSSQYRGGFSGAHRKIIVYVLNARKPAGTLAVDILSVNDDILSGMVARHWDGIFPLR